MGKKGQTPSLPEPKTANQKHLINSINAKSMTIASGPAGTGKSFITACLAAHYLKTKKVNNIIVTRPTTPTGRSIGFFPGTLEEKMEPWCKPILLTIQEIIGQGDYDCCIRNNKIEIVPFETIRGRSFESSFIILDEAQNCTVEEIKAFVTRIGEHSKAVINGDVTQSDLPTKLNGLSKIVHMVNSNESLRKYVGLINFDSSDIVRSGLCQLWVEAFEKQPN
jgi:phosphate starvation-inducible PhoH-like protein